MKPWLRLPLCLPALGLLLVAGVATAQSISPAVNFIERPGREDNNPYRLANNQVNYAECVRNDVLEFHLTNAVFDGTELRVYEGTECLTEASREGENATCRLLYDLDEDLTVNITVQQLIEPDGEHMPNTAEVCDFPALDADTLHLHFMLFEGSTPVVMTTPVTADIEYRLRGPAPPTDISLSIGEEALFVDFKPNEDVEDVVGYNVFCADGCDSTEIAAGMIPPPSKECGDSGLITDEVEAENRENGVTYKVGVSARDKFGNAGLLSETECGTPEPVVGFYEGYRAGGGKGGGGNLCSLGGPARPGFGALGAGAALFLAAAARRLRSARRRP